MISKVEDHNIGKVFFKYVSLSVLSMLGLSFYVLADTFFVANGVGSAGLTALNLVLPVYSFINGIGLMLAMGAGTRFSILKGEDQKEQGNKVFTQVLKLSLLIGLLLTLAGLFFSNNIARILGADATILPLANVYLKTIMCFSIPFIFNNVIICFIRNDGSPNLSMIAMIAGSLTNIVLDYVFIFPLKMGMFGAAFATGLAPIISLCILSIHFIKKKNSFKIVSVSFLKDEVRKICSIGLPSFITEFSSGLIMIIFNFVILGILGNTGVAAYGIVANLSLIAVAIFTGIAQGIQPIISINFGSGNLKNIRKVLVFACITAISLGSLFFLLGTTFPEIISGFFNRNDDPVLTGIASKGITIYFIAFFIMGINIVTTTFFASIAKPMQAFTISTLRGFIAIIPLILILSKTFGITGVWLTIPFTELITLFVSTVFLIKHFKK